MEDLKKDKQTISGMFDSISSWYDSLNHILSFGRDFSWRKKVVSAIEKTNSKKILDLACGTGDLTLGLLKKGFDVTGVDISVKMMEIAKAKIARCFSDNGGNEGFFSLPKFINASADELPFENGCFDAVVISFGIRNFDNRKKCLQEIFRVTKKSGSLYILEFAVPRNKIWKIPYMLYLKYILPLVGRILSKNRYAYGYLPSSVEQFPCYEDFISELEDAGYCNGKYLKFNGGAVLLYIAEKK